VQEICDLGITTPRNRVHEDFATKGGLVELRTLVKANRSWAAN